MCLVVCMCVIVLRWGVISAASLEQHEGQKEVIRTAMRGQEFFDNMWKKNNIMVGGRGGGGAEVRRRE